MREKKMEREREKAKKMKEDESFLIHYNEDDRKGMKETDRGMF